VSDGDTAKPAQFSAYLLTLVWSEIPTSRSYSDAGSESFDSVRLAPLYAQDDNAGKLRDGS